MNKKNIISSKIFDYIRNNQGISSSEIARYFNFTIPTVVSYLNSLIKKSLILKSGTAKNTRYFIKEKGILFDYDILFKSTISILSENYEIDINESEITKILKENFCYINIANGNLVYSIEAFVSRCQDPKRNFGDEIITKELARYISNFLDVEKIKKKSGFFDGTESMNLILSKYSKVYLDRVLFSQISEISGFGRTKIAIELYFGKQNSSENLLENAILPSIPKIKQYIDKNSFEIIIFVPPTIARPVQFYSILKRLLNIDFKEIIVSKINSPGKTLIAQKFTKGEERILNAESSIIIRDYNNISKDSKILIIDDNFTTGATLNAIAKKLRLLGYNGRIEAITIAGKFHYNATIDTDEI